MVDIAEMMTRVSRARPIFHSEADFQHALAWHIHQAIPDCGVRLEYRPFPNENLYLDLWLSGIGIALELKYATSRLDHDEGGENFSLRNQSARDVRRYDVVRDIERLEKVSGLPHVRGGYAILLTNDAAYWTPPTRSPDTIDAAFRVHEGRTIGGRLAWSERAGAGTTEGRQSAIEIGGRYDLRWSDYSTVGDRKNQRFRYLTVHVPG